MTVLRALDALDALRCDTLVALALVGRPCSRSHWQDAVRRADLRAPAATRGLYGEDFKRILVELERVGAVTHDPVGYTLADEWLAPVLDHAARRGRLEALASRMPRSFDYMGGSSRLGGVTALRVALAKGDDAAALLAATSLAFGWERAHLIDALGRHAPRAWIDRLSDRHRQEYLRSACDAAIEALLTVGDDVIEAAAASAEPPLVARAAAIQALRGQGAAAGQLVAKGDDAWSAGARGLVALTLGRWDEARASFGVASRSTRGLRELPSFLAPFGLLALLTDDALTDADALQRLLTKSLRPLRLWPGALEALGALVETRLRGVTHEAELFPRTWIDAIVAAVATGAQGDAGVMEWLRHHARSSGYAWVEQQLVDLVSAASPTSPTTPTPTNPTSLLRLRSQRPAWEHALDALASVATASAQAPPAATTSETLFWTLSVSPMGMHAQPRRANARGGPGKATTPERIHRDGTAHLEPRDRRIVDALVAAQHARRFGVPLRTLLLFVDHPRVRDEEGRPVAVVARDVVLRVEHGKHGATVTLDPPDFDESGVAVVEEANAFVVVTLTPAAQRLRAVLGERGIKVPPEGLGRMSDALATLSASIPVRAGASVGEELAGDPRPHVQMFRVGSSLRARIRVRPAGTSGAALRPGAPPERIAVAVDVGGAGGLRAVRRDLGAENDAAARLMELCATLASLPMDGDDRIAADLPTCLELLLELEGSGAVVEWPEGERLHAPTLLRNGSAVRVRVGGGSQWLEIDGEVRIDEARVVSMRELLAAMSSARGRFVPIGADQYLALTDDLRAKLDALGRIDQLATKGRLSIGLLPALDAVLDGTGATFTADVMRWREAFARAEQQAPEVPRTLEAELRDYQRDGFAFLARRTEAGLGACLADDMGLGKTVQALALLLHRASRGPALVVCPTSVCRNWQEEAARFAPTLRVRRLHEGDRAEAIEEAAKSDVVVASYGLLVAEKEMLAKRRWSTVVFDEAHALKNASTHRWAAARALSSDAIVALTGTPLENHAGELHAIFDVIVSGLLGPRAAFDRAFGAALADGQREAATTLRRIVRPLLLRRTKGEVLTELPPKTEMTRAIAPSSDHLAFYEAIRRRALERLHQAPALTAKGAAAGRARIEILAEITRLRRAAIDPRLVGGDDAPAGAKIDALARLVADLREEGHRALVFSQFLGVLDLARAKLEASGVRCLRLDGTMTTEARTAAVAAFQSGQADVFLLSLKAGGVGMNLTAADYVIHLDPWWNPAVEDQASDRAHRFGQTRPVTIVRLVTEGTIEEKVLALHAAKRKLYEDVVSEADGTGSLDVELLVGLLGEGGAAPATPRARGKSKRDAAVSSD